MHVCMYACYGACYFAIAIYLRDMFMCAPLFHRIFYGIKAGFYDVSYSLRCAIYRSGSRGGGFFEGCWIGFTADGW